jgi:hypothetical protein
MAPQSPLSSSILAGKTFQLAALDCSYVHMMHAALALKQMLHINRHISSKKTHALQLCRCPASLHVQAQMPPLAASTHSCHGACCM